jgi:hypothetical protein
MRKPAKILLLAVIVALLPLRSMAALMAGSCAAAQEESALAQSTVPAQDSGVDFGNADTHCPGTAFLANAAETPLLASSDGRGVVLVERTGPAFVPDKLDRPPLALLR